MKRIIIMLLIVSSAVATAQAQQKIYANTPQQVISQLEYMINMYGLPEGQTYSVNKNPNTNIIESKERIVNFSCTAVGKGPYLSNVANAFKSDEQFSYQFMHIMPGNNQPFSLQVVTSDRTTNKFLPLLTKASQEMWYMACKNPENPELRDVYAIVWAVDYMGGEPTATRGYPMNGTIYMITSLRPDIYDNEAKQSNDDVIQDLYSKQVSGLASSFRPTPEQMKLIMQKAPAIRDIMDNIQKAYAPLDREQSLHRLDMAFEQIAKKNKELDQQWQDLVKSLKDLKTPSEETKRTIDVLYNVILTLCTQQNKIFTEMYKRRGSLPISGQNAQKYINELTEKYMKEMDKFLKDTK